jgi:hypothetical protein
MSASINHVIVSAVEVIASANRVIHRINCGATTSGIPVIMNNVSWTRDMYASSGTLSNRCGTTITNSIYCSSRYFSASMGTPMRYNIPVPYNHALYSLRLHFNDMVNTQDYIRLLEVIYYPPHTVFVTEILSRICIPNMFKM